jgi:hypothetical protein
MRVSVKLKMTILFLDTRPGKNPSPTGHLPFQFKSYSEEVGFGYIWAFPTFVLAVGFRYSISHLFLFVRDVTSTTTVGKKLINPTASTKSYWAPGS